MLDIFGQDFWIELEHHLLPDDTALVDALRDVAASTGVRCIIANDVHYAYPDEYRLRDVMACIQNTHHAGRMDRDTACQRRVLPQVGGGVASHLWIAR